MKNPDFEYLAKEVFPLLNSRRIINQCYGGYIPPENIVRLENSYIEARFKGYDKNKRLFKFSFEYYIDSSSYECYSKSSVVKFPALDFINTQLPLLESLLASYMMECTVLSKVTSDLRQKIFSIKRSCGDKIEQIKIIGPPVSVDARGGRSLAFLEFDGMDERTPITMLDFARIFDIKTLKLAE